MNALKITKKDDLAYYNGEYFSDGHILFKPGFDAKLSDKALQVLIDTGQKFSRRNNILLINGDSSVPDMDNIIQSHKDNLSRSEFITQQTDNGKYLTEKKCWAVKYETVDKLTGEAGKSFYIQEHYSRFIAGLPYVHSLQVSEPGSTALVAFGDKGEFLALVMPVRVSYKKTKE